MSKRKVFIGVGHGGKDPGAVCGAKIERDLALICATACREELLNMGFKCKRSRASNKVTDTVADEVRECNEYEPCLSVEIHFNAGGGTGFEAYHVSNKGFMLGSFIQNEVRAIGQKTRGVKFRNNLYYLNHTKTIAVLLESAFVDSRDKKDDFWCSEEGAKKLGKAYANGIRNYIEHYF